jgi:SAM-dependent methyltransferase
VHRTLDLEPGRRNRLYRLGESFRGITIVQETLLKIGNRLGILSRPDHGAKVECGADWYDRAYTDIPTYHDHYTRSNYYPLWTVIVDRVRRDKLRRILEIGCGPGQLAAFLLEQGVESYVGLDFSPTAIDLARQVAPRGHFVVDDARTSQVYTQFDHDAIICTEVLEHIQDDLLVVSRFVPSKRCLCTVPNFPYESHVRHFRDGAEVASRYGRFFRDLDVMTLRSQTAEDVLYFLLDGVRNDVAA